MKKIFALLIVTMLAIGSVVPVSAHWVDEYVPSQVQSELNAYDGTAGNDVEITRLQFTKMLAKSYEIVNGRPMEKGGLYVVPFSDCSDQDVYVAATQGILNGMSEGVFGPNATLTRAQCVAMVKRAMAPTRTGNGSFPDTRGHWAQLEIAWAAENGVVHGFEDGYFYPDHNLTVAQARKILWLAQQQFGWVGVTQFSGGTGNGNGYYNGGSYNGGSFSPTPQQGQGYTNPDGTWDNGYNNGYNNNGYYNDNYYNNNSGFGQTPGYNNNSYNGGSFSNPPANGGVAGDYTPSAPTNGGGF